MALKLSREPVEIPKHVAPSQPPFRAAEREELREQDLSPVEVALDEAPSIQWTEFDGIKWAAMVDAPKDRPIYMTSDPKVDRDGTLTWWRTTRVKQTGIRGWQNISFWASVLTSRKLEFDPAWWRESMTRVIEE